VLPPATARKGIESVRRRCAQVVDVAGAVKHVELSQRLFFDAAELLHEGAHPEAPGRAVAKRHNHPRHISSKAANTSNVLRDA
jgi:hypothetical protein